MKKLIIPWDGTYLDFLSDESRATGRAESISFPTSESEVIEIVNAVRAQGQNLTTQGARTGITAGAVPNGGHVMNLTRMNAIGEIRRDERDGGATITVQSGVLLQDFARWSTCRA